MKKIIAWLIIVSALFLSTYSAFAQLGSQSVSGIKYRVNDTTAYQTAVATAHAQGYADIYFNNQAVRPHWDIWSDELGAYQHIFDFTAGAGGGTTTNPVTFNNGGSGAASGTTFDGSVARTISYNTVGAQPLDSDLTSWAAITRASGFDTWAATPSSANLRTTLTDEIGTGLFVTAPSGSTANQILRKNSGNTDTEWASTATGAAVTVTSGSNLHFTTGGNISTGAVNAFDIGGNAWISTAVTTTATLSSAYEVVHATSSGGSYTITLPAIASAGTDKIYIIIKETAANTITIDGDGSETVVGATTFAMTDLNQTLIIQAQAGGWMPINLNYSGTYTPTLTNSANLTASTARLCTFSRIGNSVTVAGQVDIDPTTTLTLTTLGISLPVASNFTTAFQAGGVGSAISVADGSAGIQSDATNDRITFQYVCTDTTNHTMTFTFTYQIL
jgi:hypothetical protein